MYEPSYVAGILILCSLSLCEAVVLQTFGTSLCPGDVAAAFICRAKGSSLTWEIEGDNDYDLLVHNYDTSSVGRTVRLNGFLSTLISRTIDEDGQSTLSSVLTISSSEERKLNITCSCSDSSDPPQTESFYYKIPAPPPSPNVTYSMSADNRAEFTWTTSTKPGQTIRHVKFSLDGDDIVVQADRQSFTVPAIALKRVLVRTVDICNQESEATVVEMDPTVPTNTVNVSCMESQLNEFYNNKASPTYKALTLPLLLLFMLILVV